MKGGTRVFNTVSTLEYLILYPIDNMAHGSCPFGQTGGGAFQP